MKIFFVVHSFDRKDRGGVLKVISDLTESFIIRENIDVNIVSFRHIENKAFQVNDKAKVLDLNMIKYDTMSYSGLKKVNWFFESYSSIYELVKNNRDAIWITSSPPLSMLFSILKIKLNIKVIGCDHISTLYGKKFPIDLIRQYLIRKLDIMVALTPPDREFYLSKNIKSVCIPNSIDFNKIKIFPNERKYIVFVGRFHQVKQPFKTIEMFIESKIHLKGIKLRMFGHGLLHENILDYISENNYQEYIEVITDESNQDNIFKDAYALIMTSLVEGFPMVLIEAISRNVPCLSFDCPYGPTTIIQNGTNGYLLNEDIEDFKEKLDLVVNMHSSNISDSIKQYSIENVTQQWISIFNNLRNK